ncbi:DUF3560 domain-containing protein [Nocardia sp. NPDC058518]|uniref:DUF3560 domain-containing protein n=1 Tax=Nocardia sp. NPDC058518 TaxID=3346534 RepID=UPI003669E477
MLTITHDRETGTLIDGTARGDGTYEILYSRGWRWSRSLGSCYVPNSPDREAKHHLIKTTAEALRAAGHDVTIEIDDTARPTAVVEADRAARQAERVAALEAKAERKSAASDAADANDRRRTEALPPGGEPVKKGHHSEGRHRRAIEKAHDAARKSVAAAKEATEAAQRAEAATHTTAHREDVGVTLRRIEALAADKRGFEREIAGTTGSYGAKPATGARLEKLTRCIEELTDKIAYWQSHVEKRKAEGVTVYTKAMLRKGDYVKYSNLGLWPYPVQRVNAKSVTVGTEYSWTETLPYHKIRGVYNSDRQPVTFDAEGNRSDGR